MSKRGIERQRRERKVREEVIGEIVKEQGESKLRREQKGRWKVNVEEIKKFREKASGVENEMSGRKCSKWKREQRRVGK